MKKKRKSKMGLAKLYLSSFGAFVFLFLFVIASPMIFGSTYSYPEASLNEYQTLNNSLNIALVKKEFNPEKNLVRLDFSIKESSNGSALANIKYEANSQYINGKKPLDVKTYKVNEKYVVVIIEGVPKDFSVLSTAISPRYIHPELQQVDDLVDRDIKFYVNESSKIVNTDLAIGSEKEYQAEYIDFQQSFLREEIALQEKTIETEKLSITEANNQIGSLEIEMKYQTTEEKFETTNDINGYKTTIIKHQNEIDLLEKSIKELNERIKLLEEKRSSIE